jgi:WD40 repeat protein/tRNA A-37 threonylcarbamoyl transferase component Bud32
MPHCPDADQLQILAQGQLADPEATHLRSHLGLCEECRRKYEQYLPHPAQANRPTQGICQAPPEGPHEYGDPPVLPSDSLPGYQILREIHRGGQGVVYQALQRATKRKVAIKVLREGPFASKRDKARFEREVEVLGQLHHPNIVGIHDSGTASGQFYFVMDYIPGQPLDVWLASGQRSIEDTLRLFSRVCEAVNAAHLRGIIHRDLKPGNIRIDGNGEPHVLDFGLAKTAAGTDVSAMTMTGQFMGSMPWASPEQAEGLPEKIDTRTDVYSLGVILYQMLTGKFPYEVIGNMRDVLDRIMKADPVRPSTVRRQINDEVETIVLKCLSKERDRRYQTAGEIARDIHRYLVGEPIEAKRDSALYVIRKSLRRYRWVAMTGVAFVALIMTALTVSLGLWKTAENRLRRETEALREAQAQRALALKAEQDALLQKRSAEEKAYLWGLDLAQKRLAKGLTAKAQEALCACPAEWRRWEWGYLMSLCNPDLATLRGHQGQVWGVAVSPDGRLIASGGWDHQIRIWDRRRAELVRILNGHQHLVYEVAFSPDGKTLASASQDRTVRLWDVTTGSTLRVLEGHRERVLSVSFSPDGNMLLSGGGSYESGKEHDNVARLWDVASGQILRELVGHKHNIYSTAFHPGNRLAATSSTDKTIRIWDVSTGGQLRTIDKHAGIAGGLAFSHDGKWLAGGGEEVAIWRVENSEGKDPTATLSGTAGVVSVSFSPDDKRIGVGTRDGRLMLFNAENSSADYVGRVHQGAARAVAFSPDGEYVVTGGEDGTVKIHPAKPTAHNLQFGDSSFFYPESVAFSRDGSLLAMSNGSEGSATLWDISTGKERLSLYGHRARIESLALSPDGRRIVTGGWDRTARVWDAQSGTQLHQTAFQNTVRGVAFSPDGARHCVGDFSFRA